MIKAIYWPLSTRPLLRIPAPAALGRPARHKAEMVLCSIFQAQNRARKMAALAALSHPASLARPGQAIL
ncbi:MAG: hypothetical protein ACLGGU_06975, partial [Gammaproteobacteria bacterium]